MFFTLIKCNNMMHDIIKAIFKQINKFKYKRQINTKKQIQSKSRFIIFKIINLYYKQVIKQCNLVFIRQIYSKQEIQMKNSKISNKTLANLNQQDLFKQKIQKSSIQLSQSKTISKNQIQNSQRQLKKSQYNTSTFNNSRQISNKNNLQQNKSILSSNQSDEQQLPTLKNQFINSKMISSNISKFSTLKSSNPAIAGYFSQFNTKYQLKQKVDTYQSGILKNLKSQFKHGKLKIEKRRPFTIKGKQKNERQEEEQLKNKLQIKRQQALSKIKQIQQQQLQIKRRAISMYDKSVKRSSSVQIHKLPSDQQQNQLIKAIIQYRKFNKQMKKKQSLVIQQKERQKILQMQKQEQIYRMRRQSRQQEIKNNMKNLLEKQKIRKSIIEQWKAKQKEIKNKKYLYIEYKQKDKQLQQAQEMENQRLIQRLRSNHVFDKQQLDKHQRKYSELIQQRKQISKSLSLSGISNKSQIRRFQKNKFHNAILKQLQDAKKRQLQSKMKIKQNEFKQKIHKYQQKIDNQIKPNLHFKKFVPLPRCMSMDALEPQQKRKLGINYLQKAKKLKKSVSKLKILQAKKLQLQKQKQQKQKNAYKDYLQQLKKNLKYDPAERKLQQILNKKKVNSDYQTLKDAKYLSEYLVQKSKNTYQQKTMLAIQKKMDILNSIY